MYLLMRIERRHEYKCSLNASRDFVLYWVFSGLLVFTVSTLVFPSFCFEKSHGSQNYWRYESYENKPPPLWFNSAINQKFFFFEWIPQTNPPRDKRSEQRKGRIHLPLWNESNIFRHGGIFNYLAIPEQIVFQHESLLWMKRVTSPL